MVEPQTRALARKLLRLADVVSATLRIPDADADPERRWLVVEAWRVVDEAIAAMTGQTPIGCAPGSLVAIARRTAAACASVVRQLDVPGRAPADEELRTRVAGFHDALLRMTGDIALSNSLRFN